MGNFIPIHPVELEGTDVSRTGAPSPCLPGPPQPAITAARQHRRAGGVRERPAGLVVRPVLAVVQRI
eukprot:gene24819-biopygen16454